MRSLVKWMIWLLVSTISAIVGVLLGLAVARIIYPPLYFISYFLLALLSLVGLAIGLALVGIVGGAVVGTIIGSIQSLFLDGDSRYKILWVVLGILGWALADVSIIGLIVPLDKGDLSPLVWRIILGALLTGVAQWIGLRGRLRKSGWRVIISTLGVLSGGLASIALLGVGSSRGVLDPFQRAASFHEFVYKANAAGLTNLNGKLVFFISSEDAYFNNWWDLWKSDGTSEGTQPFKRAYTGWNGPFITLWTPFDNTLFFSANGVLDKADAQSWKNGGGQWRTDGTSAGTLLLPYSFSDPIALAGNLYFERAPEGDPCTLYKVSASDASPILVRQLTGKCESEMAASETTLLFLTREDEADPFTCTLWSSDGTAPGTRALKMLGDEIRHYCPTDLLAVNGRLFMIVPSVDNPELWISDGMQDGTRLISKLEGATDVMPHSSPIQVGGIYFFSVPDKTGTCALWRSDGTPEGTYPFKHACGYQLTSFEEKLIFVVDKPGGGSDLWRSDGTVEGTAVISGFFPEIRGWRPELIGEINGDLFWIIRNGERCGLWKSHGIQAGMAPIAELCPSEWTIVNNTLFFLTQKNDFTLELWRTDGTSSGTTLIRTIP